jgi:hypothetical protein
MILKKMQRSIVALVMRICSMYLKSRQMSKPTIKCSRCDRTFNGGFDYRMHFEEHMDEWYGAQDKDEYIKRTTE